MTDRTITYSPQGTAASIAEVGDYLALFKPRVMSLVVFTGFAGLYLAPGTLHPVLAVTAMLCIAIGAGASGAINMWYDRDIDARMARTRGRPIPAVHSFSRNMARKGTTWKECKQIRPRLLRR